MVDIEKLKTQFATKKEIAELTKAMATIGTGGTAGAIMEVDIDNELEKLQFARAPFLKYLEGAGVATSTKSWKVEYKIKDRKQKASYIQQTDSIPEHDPSIFTDKSAEMSLAVYPIEIGDFVDSAETKIDVTQDEINDGILDISTVKNNTLFNGVGAPNKDFKGILGQITTNKDSAGDNPLTEKMVDNTAEKIEEVGGSISALVTSPKVAGQLKDILYPNVRHIDKVELTLGFRVTAYNTPSGVDVPIITDSRIAADGIHRIGFIDNSSLRIKTLLEPTVVDLAKTKLASSKVIVNATTFFNRAEYHNGLLEDIKVV